MKDIEDRARKAYFRRFGENAPVPSVDVDEAEGIVELYNVNGVLGAYRITDNGLQWDRDLAESLQHRDDQLVRSRVKTLTFHDGTAQWWGDFCDQLEEWNAKFRLELHGDDAVYRGTARTTSKDCWEPQVNWDNVPAGDRKFLASLKYFVSTAFRMSVHVRLVVEPVDLDEVEVEYLEEEEAEDDAL